MWRHLVQRVSLLALVVGGLSFHAAPALAQELVLSGRVLGPGDQPVAGQRVLLHRVTPGAGGANLAEASTGEDGRFTVRTSSDASLDGVFFVAARYQGGLYVGPLLRAPFPQDSGYVVRVGVPGVGDVGALAGAANAGAAPGSPPAGAAPGAVFAILLLAVAIVLGAHLTFNGLGPARRRRALIALARLEEGRARKRAGADRDGARRRTLLMRAVDAP